MEKTRTRGPSLLLVLTLTLALCGQETWALAGTTGGLSGGITQSDTGAPVPNAKVTASSPSETATAVSDASGHFTFISLAPDTYSVSVQKTGFEDASIAGISVFADATQTVQVSLQPALKTIATVRSRPTGSLVKPGTTADVYSINASTQDKMSGLGGGGGLNSAYSAIASVPGAFMPLNQMAYFQTIHIRGGDYDQVGYELDGVPVNRAFDNYPSGAASSLGQQELQVYTGASPANSEGQGLAGYINQVIKTGTYPGFGMATLGIGSPTFYHKLAVEAGGSQPNRMFSYYIGIGGYNQDFRFIDQNNGASDSAFAGPLETIAAGSPNCPAMLAPVGCFQMAPYQYALQSSVADRDVVANLHFGIPHKYDNGKDDVQLLWDSAYLANSFYNSTNDAGGPAAFGGAANAPAFLDGYQWTCAVGTTTNALNSSCVQPYYFPNVPAHSFGGTIPYDLRDTLRNNQEIFKAQYQRNINSSSFLRLYGYTYYSNWLQSGPNSTDANFIACCPSDYELSSHTRGVSLTYSLQATDKHLITFQGSYTTSTSLRDNNTQFANGGGARSRGVVMVNANAPLSGYCFDPAGNVITCDPAGDANGDRANFATWSSIFNGTTPALASSCNIPGGAAGPCTWLVAENSQWATLNSVTPKFTAISLTDEYRPSSKLLFNLGLRYDQFQFDGSPVRNDPARTFWYTAFNLDNCVNSAGLPVDKSSLGLLPTDACPSGYTPANMQNISGTNTYDILQPRLGGTYTIDPDTVLRFSAGKYAEPPNAAFQQYDTAEEDTPFELSGSRAFYSFGFTDPGLHQVRPPTSLNFDFSLEKHLKGTDVSFKVTPFLRKTKDQIQQFFLDQKTAFVSGLNVGRQTSEGVEFQLNKGDFSRNGLSGQLSFAYTHSAIRYDALNNGSTVVTGVNADIAHYNSLTQAGGGSPCYLNGNPSSCSAAGAIANPYYNAPIQALVDAGSDFATYTFFPGPMESSAAAYGAPYVATLLLNYKHDRFAITPSLQFQGGARYGAPETTPGIDPATCGAPLAAAVAPNDPRYPYGSAGGGSYDATNCGTLVIPDPYTGRFDGVGAFVQPNQILGNIQISYDVSPKITLVGTFANVLSSCWGGTKAAWTVNNHQICSYNILNTGGGIVPVGNVYNTPATVADFQRVVQYPYAAYFGAANTNTSAGNFNQTINPFQFFLEARIRI